MHTYLEKIIGFLVMIIKVLLNLVISFIFIVIPTLLLNPENNISSIENDICIDFPEKYTTIDKYQDWMGFDLHYEFKFKFPEEEFSNILKQISVNSCQNGHWSESDGMLKFAINEDYNGKNEYFSATIDREENTLDYLYSEY